jgi:cell division protein ZapA (FtsZ GTPase activity inhibitor)
MPATNDTTVVVSINGKSYTMALEPGQTPEHIREVAQLVDGAMRGVQEAGFPGAPVHLAILAGLGLAEELFGLQSEYQAAETDIAQRTSRLAASLGRVSDARRIETLSPDRS